MVWVKFLDIEVRSLCLVISATPLGTDNLSRLDLTLMAISLVESVLSIAFINQGVIHLVILLERRPRLGQ